MLNALLCWQITGPRQHHPVGAVAPACCSTLCTHLCSEHYHSICCFGELVQCSTCGSLWAADHTLECLPPQAHLWPIIAVVVAITAPSKAKPPSGFVLPSALHLLLTTAALASARLVLFDVLLLLLGYPPSAALLAGAGLVALALAQIPLVQRRCPHSQSARRGMAAVAAFGVLLALLRPPLPEKVGTVSCVVRAHTLRTRA